MCHREEPPNFQYKGDLPDCVVQAGEAICLPAIFLEGAVDVLFIYPIAQIVPHCRIPPWRDSECGTSAILLPPIIYDMAAYRHVIV